MTRISPLPRIPVLGLAVLICAILSTPARIQAQGSLKQDEAPVTVEADQGIEWISESKMYVARGNAKATRGNVSVAGDTLSALYRETETEDTEIYRLEAQGHVVIASPERTAFGDRAVYDLDQAVAVMYGESLRLVTKDETITATDSLEYWEQRRVAVARGNAVAVQKGRRIRADALTAIFEEAKDGSLEATRMDAVGGVVITTPQEVARAREGVYNVKTGIATLSGDVKITRGETQLNGAVAEVNLKTGISKLLSSGSKSKPGRVRGLFVPRSKTKQN